MNDVSPTSEDAVRSNVSGVALRTTSRWLGGFVKGLGDLAQMLVHRPEEKHAGCDEYDDN
jgi:hypothetical protein